MTASPTRSRRRPAGRCSSKARTSPGRTSCRRPRFGRTDASDRSRRGKRVPLREDERSTPAHARTLLARERGTLAARVGERPQVRQHRFAWIADPPTTALAYNVFVSLEQIRQISAAIPEGWWTTYQDVGELVYGHRRAMQRVGDLLCRAGDVGGAHRILLQGGHISNGWRRTTVDRRCACACFAQNSRGTTRAAARGRTGISTRPHCGDPTEHQTGRWARRWAPVAAWGWGQWTNTGSACRRTGERPHARIAAVRRLRKARKTIVHDFAMSSITGKPRRSVSEVWVHLSRKEARELLATLRIGQRKGRVQGPVGRCMLVRHPI